MMPVMIDSGAFSVSTGKAKITLGDYIAFLKSTLAKNPDANIVYVNLDVIGDAEASYQNWKEMVAEGLSPIPVYHPGSSPRYLDEYVAGSKYMGLGGVAKESSRQAYLDQTWRRLVDADGMPITKVHGFGIVSFSLVERYPWYSVDGTSVMRKAANGGIFLPKKLGSGVDFTKGLRSIFVSMETSKVSELGQHFDTLSVEERRLIGEFVLENGFTVKALTEHWYPRVQFNLWIMGSWFKTLAWPRPISPSVPRSWLT